MQLTVGLILICLSTALGQNESVAANDIKKSTWRFAVSGDSRNCGDVVMAAIAEKVRADGASFYWHLGDYRAIYDFDEDFRQVNPKSDILTYQTAAWPDFIQQQLVPFGDLPVYLSLGNHETIPPRHALKPSSNLRIGWARLNSRLRDFMTTRRIISLSLTIIGSGTEWISLPLIMHQMISSTTRS